MKIAMPIPPMGWGAVEILIWDLSNSLQRAGHITCIINNSNPHEIIRLVNEFNPDFLHICYDDWIVIYPYLNYPKAITTHFAYLTQPNKWGGYVNMLNTFGQIKPNIFGLSKEILSIYKNFLNFSDDQLYFTPNGVDINLFKFNEDILYENRSIYLAKIDDRKQQWLYQNIDNLWFAGNNADYRFTNQNRYLGEWDKPTLYQNLTNYSNLVLLSDGEAHPLVCMEALCAGLGLVISEWATANLDLTLPWISVIPGNELNNILLVRNLIEKNRKVSNQFRKNIRNYGLTFSWDLVVENYFIPCVNDVISKWHNLK
jgi:hypothetical protein